MKSENTVSPPLVGDMSAPVIRENTYIRLRSLRSTAKTHIANKCYSKAIDWYEKAFELGLHFQSQIEMREILDIAFRLCELAIDLPKSDRNYCRPIYIARRCLKHFSKDKEGVEHGVFLAWAVVREYKPIVETLCIEDQNALCILEHEKNRFPNSMNENNYLRN